VIGDPLNMDYLYLISVICCDSFDEIKCINCSLDLFYAPHFSPRNPKIKRRKRKGKKIERGEGKEGWE
jgi:hypothetical protein